MKNYLTYPCKYMNISQSYTSIYSHSIHSSGTPCDYPIDEPCKDTGRDWFYCPCDEMKVVRIYGVGNRGTNTLWLTSTSKVIMPCCEDYVTILIMHLEDDDLSMLKTGQIFKRGDAICKEGSDGKSTGNHFHISFGRGTIVGNGWQSNTKDAWCLRTTGGTIKPEDACYIDTTFTTVMRTQGIKFKNVPDDFTNGNTNQQNYAMLGIDVSKHNGAINWKDVAESGIKFVIARAGYGYGENQIDSRFHENMSMALKYGLHIGAYWFSYAIKLSDIKEEAKQFAKTLEPYRGKMDFPVFYDLEYDGFNYAKRFGVTINKKMATEFAIEFCKEMNKYGWMCHNYTNLDCLLRYFDSDKMKGIDTWLAQWTTKDTPSAECTIWQYSNTGNIKGIAGNVDMDICYKNYPSIIKEEGWNGYSIPDKNNENIQKLKDEIVLLKTEKEMLEIKLEEYKTVISSIIKQLSELK